MRLLFLFILWDMPKIKQVEPGTGIYTYYCPGCECNHEVYTNMQYSSGPLWEWNGSTEKPTFRPGMIGEGKNFTGIQLTYCRHKIVDGFIIFHPDCSHQLAGKRIMLPEVK